MSRYKLLVTDLDGTLLDPSGNVHEADRRAIVALRQKGMIVSVCTGRMYSGTREIARSLGIGGAVGCLDGSQVVNSSDDSDLVCHPIEVEATDPLREALSEFEPVTFVFAQDRVLHCARGERYLPFVALWSKHSVKLPSVLDYDPHETSVTALVSLGSEAQILGAAARIQARAAAHLQIGFFAVARDDFDATCGMVVRAAGISKATALARITEFYRVSIEETVAVGDWINDISMLRIAGRGFAMGQAPDEVKAAAHEVLDATAWQGGGIAEAAERAGML